jgi:hypothetical protein
MATRLEAIRCNSDAIQAAQHCEYMGRFAEVICKDAFRATELTGRGLYAAAIQTADRLIAEAHLMRAEVAEVMRLERLSKL